MNQPLLFSMLSLELWGSGTLDLDSSTFPASVKQEDMDPLVDILQYEKQQFIRDQYESTMSIDSFFKILSYLLYSFLL